MKPQTTPFASTLEITPPRPGAVGATVSGLDPKRLHSDDVAGILDAVYRHKLLVFRGVPPMDNETYLALARNFGRLQVYFQDHYHHPDHPEIFVSSNVPENGRKVGVAGTGRFWHTDYAFFDEPLSLTFVYPKVLPRGRRETLFIDMQQALARLPDDLAHLARTRRFFHEATWYYKVQPRDIDRPIIDLVREFRELSPGAWHPGVLTHPVTGGASLYLSEGFTTKVEGLSTDESAAILPRFFESIATCPVHAHPWSPGDLLFWDNRALLHRSGDVAPGEASCSYRIGVYDRHPFHVPGTRA